MKKNINKTTVIIVLAVFLTISVGYALFSDTITIEGTATAQGNFDIEATCLTTIPDELVNILDKELAGSIKNSNGYKDESCTISDDKVTYSVGLEYPGARKYYAIKFTNAGSIDSKVSAETIASQFENTTIKVYNSSNELVKTEEGSDNFISLDSFIFQKEDNSYINLNDSSEEDFEYFADIESKSYLLRTGKNWYWLFEAEWPIGGYQEEGMHYEATHTMTIPFEQYTK